MDRIVVEINGHRHKLVKDNKENGVSCKQECSLYHLCQANSSVGICSIFAAHLYEYHFEKEKKEKIIKTN